MRLQSQSGGASIISVGFISLFILILTVAITRLMVGEMRHAIDMESNISAYYEAEGGVEEAVLALRQLIEHDPSQLLTLANQNCDRTSAATDGVLINFDGSGTGFTHNANITCRRVRTAANLVDSTLQLNESAHYDLTRKNFERIEITWDNVDIEKDGSVVTFTDNTQAGSPPYLEVTRIDYVDANPATPATEIDPGAVRLKSLFLAPYNAATDCLNGAELDFETCLAAEGGGLVKTKCLTKALRCTATIINFIPFTAPDTRTVLRLRPHFGGAKYTMKIFDSLDNRVDVVLDKTIIDVTARVGNSYRRIQQEVSMVQQPVNGLEAVFGDDKVCKKFSIIDTGSGEFLDPDSVPSDCLLD